MKVTKLEAQKIADNYLLGKVKTLKLVKGGLVNYNFELKTDKGEYIIRFLGHTIDKWKKDKIKNEFLVLKYLKDKNFPYKIPFPIKNKRNKVLTQFKKRYFWVYEKINGDIIRRRLTKGKLMNMAKTLAEYHKIIAKLKFKSEPKKFNWLLGKYKDMKKIKPKNKTDRLMLENVDFFDNLVKKIKDIKFKNNNNVLANHGDFCKTNLLFKGDEIVAILDFDNLKIAPRINDISYTIEQCCFENNRLSKKKMNLFLKEYEQINKLSKEEKKVIFYYILLDKAVVFWWFYAEMKKRQDMRYNFIAWTVDSSKNLLNDFGEEMRYLRLN